ncbi:MAG: hypothetical protein ACLQLC_10210 [Candidatus Sulfotelmatobacter sp.]
MKDILRPIALAGSIVLGVFFVAGMVALTYIYIETYRLPPSLSRSLVIIGSLYIEWFEI